MNRSILTEIYNKSKTEWSLNSLIQQIKQDRVERQKKFKQDMIVKALANQLKLAL